jgi:subtilisin family serine protease
MTRIAALLSVALAALVASDARHPGSVEPETARVVARLHAPALAFGPGSGDWLERQQAAFRAELAGALPDASVRWRYRLVLNGFAVDLPRAQVARLRTLPGVADVYESAQYVPQLDASPGQIGAPGLWGPGLATSGQGMKIGIIDAGVDPGHAFFDPSGFSMPSGFPKGQTRFTSAKVIVARAFPPPGAQTDEAALAFDSDESSHGTHVAGIAAGNRGTDAGARTVSGVAPRAYIGNYRALVRTDSGLSPNGNAPELVAAIEAAVADGMDVINLSLGEPEIEPTRDVVALALDAAAAAGVVPVVVAGNDYNDAGAGSIASPGNSQAAITVAAVEISGQTRVHADFSSVGPTTMSQRLKPDVAAPGVDILSSVPGGWAGLSGTSMAAPHVAGAAALLRQRHPSWSVAQVKSALVQTGVDATDERSGVLGPQFQGGGVVALGRADRPLLFAQPSGVSFGLATRGSRSRGSIRLDDAGGGAGTWQVRQVRPLASTGRADLALPATVDVPGALAYELAVPAGAAQGDVTGFVELRRGEDIRRVPFWGRVSAAALGRHRPTALRRPGAYRSTTAGRPSLVTRYRYPENPRGLGVTTMLRGPERVYRFRLARRVANLGVVVTSRGANVRVEPRVVSGLDENRLTGYAALPVNHNPYLEGFRTSVLAAGALSPRPGDYAIVFDSATRAGAGRFTFRFWVNDVLPPRLRVPSRTVRAGARLRILASDAGSGIHAPSLVVTVDGGRIDARVRDGVIAIETIGMSRGTHRLRVRLSDVQETKNTENVARILPNTRTLTTTFSVR